MTSAWGDERPDGGEHPWTNSELREVSGAKWREAARAYFRAALFESRSSSDDEKGQTFERYSVPVAPEPERWPEQPPPGDPARFFFEERDDIDRMGRCWQEWARARREAFAGSGSAKAIHFIDCHIERRAQEGLANNLGVLEDALRAASRGPQVREVMAKRHTAQLACLRAQASERWHGARLTECPDEWPAEEARAAKLAVDGDNAGRAVLALGRWLVARAYHLATGTGTSILRTLRVLVLWFCGVMPGLFLLSGGLFRVGAGGAQGAPVGSYFTALRFTIAQALTVTPADLTPVSTLARWLAVIDTLLAAFSVGYTVWVMTQNSQ